MSRLTPTPSSANPRPIRAAKSSSRITGSSGCLARRMNCTNDASPLIFEVSMIAVRNENASITIDATSTTSGTHHQRESRSESSGWPWAAWTSWNLWYAS